MSIFKHIAIKTKILYVLTYNIMHFIEKIRSFNVVYYFFTMFISPNNLLNYENNYF